ncbi:hypothetical protein GALMADRAFT_141284 [Galerina marginata CBS 339.88]|uniref:hAT-like transposase RNase-H fold domain-containing protein n=1 Tax=Galerina marginata (strain CBS 339.88) TaxID=685588 RepID=A0A067SVV2_GALM3|nr:hypothetical protein GALMADRAFT_141284 [Galerina marginata CBS 339.88]
MIEELGNLLEDLPGAANQMRCFTHMLNLIVKSIIKQFDKPEAKANKVFDNATKELLKLAGDINAEEKESKPGEDGESGEVDSVEGWVDECKMMSEEELLELDLCVKPVCLLLTKLCKTAFAIKNSTTIILPRWFSVLEDLKIPA